MADAFFHQGLTIEIEDRIPLLRVEGRRVLVERTPNGFRLEAEADVRAPTLVALGHLLIEREYKDRAALRKQHLDILNQGRDTWNEWRRGQPEIRPVLYEAVLGKDIHISDLSEFDFSWAGLAGAQLPGANLTRANFFQAHLSRTVFTGATLNAAHFCRADLYETDLSGAFLIEANLQGAQLAKTNLSGAHLIRCAVYGMSAWDVQLKNAEQRDLILRYRYGSDDVRSGVGTETEIRVDDLQIAQFIYLMLDNPQIRVVLESSMKKSVLILGRFADTSRKAVLEAIRGRLRQLGHLPIIFDFDAPSEKDLIQTITILAGLSRFVIGDVTDARSIPLEFGAILQSYKIPVVPIIAGDGDPFSMLESLRQRYFPCVLELRRYVSLEVLDRDIEKIVEAALGQESLIRSQSRPPQNSIELR